MNRWLPALSRGAFLASMWAGAALITVTSLVYFDFDTVPPFVIEKLPVRFETLWLWSLRVHVASALFSFPLCLLLMARFLQRRARWHRWVGRVTGVFVLFALVPSGVVLAFDAKGGPWVTAGFLLSAAIVAASMSFGVLAARRRDLLSHAHFMRHVVAQMSVAVSSRALIIAFEQMAVSPELSYLLALWLPVLASAALAELVSSRARFSCTRIVSAFQRMYRELISPSVLVRARTAARPFTRPGR